jgi:RNA polymerase sigma-32 factor
VPSIGNLDAYISAVNRLPMLTPQEKAISPGACASRVTWKPPEAGAVAPAPGGLGLAPVPGLSGCRRATSSEEGNVGLMKAVKRFDPEQGVRLVSYALHWIKAEIHEYILRNWRMVKVATTKAQRKLFFNLRSMKQGLKRRARPTARRTAARSPRRKWPCVARELQVKPEEVVEMETRLSGGDLALEPQADDGEDEPAPDRLPGRRAPRARRARWRPRSRDWLAGDGI